MTFSTSLGYVFKCELLSHLGREVVFFWLARAHISLWQKNNHHPDVPYLARRGGAGKGEVRRSDEFAAYTRRCCHTHSSCV